MLRPIFSTFRVQSRNLSTTLVRASEVAPTLKKTKNIGTLRGSLLGFLLGISTTGIAGYYYLLEEYHSSNSLIIGDVLKLSQSVKVLENHVKTLEAEISSNSPAQK